MTSSRIETHTGLFVNPLDLQPGDVNIADIAHALAMQCRFGGHSSRHYSVAEHSVNVMKVVERRVVWEKSVPWPLAPGEKPMFTTNTTILRQALLHDATEAYCVDLPMPLKRSTELAAFKGVEDRIWAVIAPKFNVPVELHPWIKEADRRMCSTEKLALLSTYVSEWEWGDFMRQYPPYLPAEYEPDLHWEITPRQARKRFLDAFDQVA